MASAERHGFVVAGRFLLPRSSGDSRLGTCRYQRTCRSRSAGEPGLRGPGRDDAGACRDPEGRPGPGSSPLSKSRRSRRCCRVQAARPGWPGRRIAPGLRLLGRQPRGRPGGRRPGRAGVLSLLARHRASPRARRRQRRLLVPRVGRHAASARLPRRPGHPGRDGDHRCTAAAGGTDGTPWP